jgi:hypothetical protein
MHLYLCLLPGHHQLHPTLLGLSQNLRPTLAPIHLHSHRRILIVHGRVQENGIRGVGGHEGAASHGNHLLIETAVTSQVPGIDASITRARRRCYLHLSCLRVSCIVYARYSIPCNYSPHNICGTGRESNYDANGGRLVRVYKSGGKRHKQTASDALVFMINATMSLPRFDFQWRLTRMLRRSRKHAPVQAQYLTKDEDQNHRHKYLGFSDVGTDALSNMSHIEHSLEGF